MKRARVLTLLCAAPAACARGPAPVAVGSKNFTESLVLGELYAQTLERRGIPVARKLDLGGTDIAMAALRRGEIDLYPEYTGTALLVVLKAEPLGDAAAQYAFVKAAYAERFGLTWLAPAPFNDMQALAVTRSLAARYGLRTLSDLARQAPLLRLGAVPEFVKRPDGLPGLRARYGGFAFKDVRLIDFGLKYEALLRGDVDVIVAFGTDGSLAGGDFVVLDDDRKLFPAYEVAPVVRSAVLTARPALAPALDAIAPLLTDSVMRGLNEEVDGPRKREPAETAKDFIEAHGLG